MQLLNRYKNYGDWLKECDRRAELRKKRESVEKLNFKPKIILRKKEVQRV